MDDSASSPSPGRRANLVFHNRLRRNSAWWLLALLTVVGLAAIITSAWLAHLTPNKDEWLNSLWLEVAKAGVQVVAVGVLGGALTAICRTSGRAAIGKSNATKRSAPNLSRWLPCITM